MQLENALHTLGINALRPFQEEALNTLLTGRSLLTLMPTSAGKSLIFTSFAMVQERLTIVIEPHLALELDQVRQLHQLYQDLVHIVDDRYNFTLTQVADVDLYRTGIDQGNDSTVYDDIGHRIHAGTDLTYEDLHGGQCLIVLPESLFFLRFLMECTDDTDTGQILSGDAQYLIQPGLHLFVHRDCG